MCISKRKNKVNKIRYNKVILYVVRVDSNDFLQESCPCVDCMKKISDLKIEKFSRLKIGE